MVTFQENFLISLFLACECPVVPAPFMYSIPGFSVLSTDLLFFFFFFPLIPHCLD